MIARKIRSAVIAVAFASAFFACDLPVEETSQELGSGTLISTWVRFYDDGEEIPCALARDWKFSVSSRGVGPDPGPLTEYRCESTLSAPEWRIGSGVYEYRVSRSTYIHVFVANGIEHTVALSSSEKEYGHAWRFVTVTHE